MVLGGGPLPLQKLLAKVIVKYIKDNDTLQKMLVHPKWESSLEEQVLRLLSVNQVLGYTRKGQLTGVFGWALIDDIKKVNKIRWTLPDNIISGHILYVSFGVLDKEERIGLVKKFFDESDFKFDEAIWTYNMRMFKNKRRMKCLIAD